MPQSNSQILKSLLKDLTGKNSTQTADLLEKSLLEVVEKRSKNTVLVESAVELSSEQIKEIESMFSSTYEIKYSVNKDIIGGLRVTVGDKLYDLSLVTSITNLSNI